MFVFNASQPKTVLIHGTDFTLFASLATSRFTTYRHSLTVTLHPKTIHSEIIVFSFSLFDCQDFTLAHSEILLMSGKEFFNMGKALNYGEIKYFA